MSPPQAKRSITASGAQLQATDDAIRATVGAFATRMARKLHEQRQVDTSLAKQSELTQQRILKAMANIRRGFQEASKLDVGVRFSLEVDVSDWEGWPRVQLNLVDSLRDFTAVQTLVSSVNEAKNASGLRFVLNSDALLGEASLTTDSDLERVLPVLQRSIREFLDAAAEYVLKPDQRPANNKGNDIEELSADLISRKLARENLFAEEPDNSDNLVDSADHSPIDDGL